MNTSGLNWKHMFLMGSLWKQMVIHNLKPSQSAFPLWLPMVPYRLLLPRTVAGLLASPSFISKMPKIDLFILFRDPPFPSQPAIHPAAARPNSWKASKSRSARSRPAPSATRHVRWPEWSETTRKSVGKIVEKWGLTMYIYICMCVCAWTQI